MAIDETLLEIRTHHLAGYRPLIDYQSWRVAILNYSDELRPERIDALQRHNETDEVFVLLRGRCLLFVADGTEKVERIFAQDMEPLKLYNVKKAVWHSHALSPDAMVLIVENRETTYDNSPFCALTTDQRRLLIRLGHQAGYTNDMQGA